MLTLGRPRTAELDDGWTVVTVDGSPAVHVEHSIALCEDGVWVLTAADGGRDRLGDLLASAAGRDVTAPEQRLSS
jgi:methionyl aminopeptidase